MDRKHSMKALTVAAIGFAALSLSVLAAQPLSVDFANETAGGEPKSLVPVVGVWRRESASKQPPTSVIAAGRWRHVVSRERKSRIA